MIRHKLKLLIALSSIVTITTPTNAEAFDMSSMAFDANNGKFESLLYPKFSDKIFDYSQFVYTTPLNKAKHNYYNGFYEFRERNTGTYFEEKQPWRNFTGISVQGSDWEWTPINNGRTNTVTNSVGIAEFNAVNFFKIWSKTKINLDLGFNTSAEGKVKISGYVGDGKSTLSDESIPATTITTLTAEPNPKSTKDNSVDVTDIVKNAVESKNYFVGFRFEPATPDTIASIGAKLVFEDDPWDILSNSKLAATPSSYDIEKNPANEKIEIYFRPYNSFGNTVAIDKLADALGYDDFNFLQIVEEVPSSVTWFTGLGKRVVHQGNITTPLGHGKFFDFLRGGNLICSYSDFDSINPDFKSLLNKTQLNQKEINEIQKIEDTQIGCTLLKKDNFAFYLNFPRNSYSRGGSEISMIDIPTLGHNPSSEFMKFHTMLVGVKNGGTHFDVFADKNVIWKSNTRGCKVDSNLNFSDCSGELTIVPCRLRKHSVCPEDLNVAGSSNELLTFPVTGGIEIIDSGVPFDEFSDELIAFLQANNGTLINSDGTIFTREGSNSSNKENSDSSGSEDNGNGSNSGIQTVPEPSTLLGLSLVIGLGSVYKKNKNKSLPS